MKKKYVVLSMVLSVTMMTACTNQSTESQNTNVDEANKSEIIKEDTNKKSSILQDYMENNMNIATIKTNMGEIKIELNPDKAPISVANFKQYVDEGFYSNTIFHRVMDGFMIQGGGFTADKAQKGTHNPIKNEADNGLKNKRGTLAMARTMVVDSATSQFFINLVDNDFLDFKDATPQGYGYAVFGEVIEGMDIVDAIAKVKVANNGGHANWPVDEVLIESIELSK